MSLVKKESAKLALKVQTGMNAKGSPVYATRTVSSINPSLTEDDVYVIGKKIAALQAYALESISLQVTDVLSE